MAKMFYSQEEAAGKLGVSVDALKGMIREGRLREFMDNGPVYRVEDIDKLAGAPAAGDAIDLELVQDESEPGKEDTVITSAGISVFDDEDLQIEADPLAQTQITPSVEDQISLEGVGSGSGLLDLTREADDTSLGAELWEEIAPVAPTIESADLVGVGAAAAQAQEETIFAAPMEIEATDPTTPAFSAMALVGIIASLLLAMMVVSMYYEVWPDLLTSLSAGSTPFVVGGVLVVVMVLCGVVGMVLGKGRAGPRI